jgi:hypothetical protein
MRLVLSSVGVLAILAIVILRRRRWLDRERVAVDQRIQANRAQTKPDFAIADDRLRVNTIERRKTADRLRARAAHVESGASAAQTLRAVK